ncbi:MAG: hypothetical protein LPK26_13530 [Bacillaceae bacterium]|nr:hypothetical protein [Bacillaceae bacterium]
MGKITSEANTQVIDKDEYIRQLQLEVIEMLNREEDALKSAIAKTYKIEELNRKVAFLESRYNALSRSRFGKLQLKYWSLKNKLSRRGKK